ncbi:MAG: glycosyltransferase family 2 protein, partial [Myxococcales bacterium]|nr:glycosyltransferase family 2 protein [Myxococcales bacterium]
MRKRRPRRRGPAKRGGTISLCMIVKNEARFLGRCLAGARDVVDQMVVVDTGSTDATVAIAEAAGAEVHHWAWRDDFAQARNVSLGYATGDWILILDGDERFAEGAAEALRALDLGPDAPDAYDFEVINYSTDRHRRSEAMLQRQIRLFRNRPNFRYSGHVHNQIADLASGWPLEGPPAPVAVEHFGYTPTVWAHQRKVERLTMLERAVREQPDSPFTHYNLANHLKILERFDEALSHYRACLDRLAGERSLEWHTMAAVMAAFCAH